MRLAAKLRAQPSAAIVWISSQSHTAAKFDRDNVILVGNESADASYARTKLANLLTCFALAQSWRNTPIQNVAFDPGPTETPLMDELRVQNSGLKGLLLRTLVPLFSSKASDVAKDLVWAIDQSLLTRNQGAYFGSGRKKLKASARAHNKELISAVLKACEQATGVGLGQLGPVAAD